MRSQNIKVNNIGSSFGSIGSSFGSVGKVGCLGLLALSFALVNPMSCLSAFAEGDDAEEAGVPVTQSSVPSSVQISFGEPVGVSSLTPINMDGASALYSVRATVDVSNSGGYTVYLGSNKAELTGKSSGATINGVTSSTSYEGMPVNSWGYSYNEGEDAGTTFSAMPANIRGVTLGGNNSTNIKTDSKTFTLSFAAHIGNDKPADTYENEVTMSVVSSPLEITNAFGIETMQEMTAKICEDVEVGTTDRLRDSRDDKMYWVKKMPDNQCWMVQNLALDLGTEWPDASKSDYEVANTTYKPVATAKTITTSNLGATNTATRSWNLGDYVIISPTVSYDCGNAKTSLADCPNKFVAVNGKTPSSNASFYNTTGGVIDDDQYDAHYLVGNFYQWNTATAGTGGTIASGQASGSICPKGWKLPTSSNDDPGSFGGLLKAGGIGSDVAKITGDDYFFVRAGAVAQSASYLLNRAGDSGHYWSSTPYNNGTYAYYLTFSGASEVSGSSGWARMDARSVRCIAR